MNPYIIDRQPQPNLIDAFMRGREQVENMRANRQTRELNDLKLQSERDRIKQAKIEFEKQRETEDLYKIVGSELAKNRGDFEATRNTLGSAFPNKALDINKILMDAKAGYPDPMKQREQEIGLKTKENDLVRDFGVPKAKAFLSLPQGEQLEYFTDFANDLKQSGIPVPPEWAEGFTPESLNQVKMLASMEDPRGQVAEAKPFFRDEPGQEPLLVYPDGTVKKLGLKPKPIKQEEPKQPKTVMIDGKPYMQQEDGSFKSAKYDKPQTTSNKDKFEALPIESQEQIRDLAKASAKKRSIVNSMSGYLSEYDVALAKWQKSKSKSDYNDVIRIGSQALKTLNSPEGADAIGAEEAKRLGTALEFNWGNLVNPGAVVGRDLAGFSRQIKNTMGAIGTGLKANDDYIKKLYNTGNQYDPNTFFND
jgi:hypothetical protein